MLLLLDIFNDLKFLFFRSYYFLFYFDNLL